MDTPTQTQQARFIALADQVRAHFEDGFKILAQLYQERAHEAFGLTWPEYFAREFGQVMTKIRDVNLRRDVVKKLTDAGMTKNEVAQATGVGPATVDRDRASNDAKRSPAPEPTTSMVRAGILKNLDDGLDKLFKITVSSPKEADTVRADLGRIRDRASALIERMNNRA